MGHPKYVFFGFFTWHANLIESCGIQKMVKNSRKISISLINHLLYQTVHKIGITATTKIYKCPYCDKTFMYATSYEAHVSTHTGTYRIGHFSINDILY